MLNDIEQRALRGVITNANNGILSSAGIFLDLEYGGLIEEIADSTIPEMKFIRAPSPKYQSDLINLLWKYRVNNSSESKLMAAVISAACYGSRHLWEDIGLTGRPEVTCLLETHFPDVARRNVQNYKWKKFLFVELGNSLGLDDLRPPKCDGCDQFGVCFP